MSQATRNIFAGVKMVVFDFDGVILESGEIKTRAFLELFSDRPEHLESIRRHHLENLAISRFVKFEWIYRELLGRALSEAEAENLGERFSKLVLEDVLRCPFVPGALEALEEILGHIPAYVASGTPHEELRLIVEARGLDRYFEEVFGTPATKVEILGGLMRKHGLEPAEILFIGDGESDWKAAEALGLPFLARRTPEQCVWLDRISVPEVDDLRPLPSLLGLVEGSTREPAMG